MGSPIAFQEVYKAGFDDFAIPVYEVAPFTTIVNRAMVTRSLKAIAGVERIMCKGINQLQNEFGANGERVFESSDKDARIRFVGNWYQAADTAGTRVNSGLNIADYVEVTFYGTGLNVMKILNSATHNLVASIDGGADGSNLASASYSGILVSRNYSPNTVLPIVSNLAPGWHTVRIRNNTVSKDINLNGFEILNQRTDLAVYQGSAIVKGNVSGLAALATSPFNAGVVGTRGARVVKHILNGALSQSVREVNAASAFLTAADHANEEVVRRINFREFGANRADDFSTLSTVRASAFTLDDGTTTLTTNASVTQTVNGQDVVIPNAVAAFITLTFVGTGLDISYSTGASTVDNFQIFVDGDSVGTSLQLSSMTGAIARIVSGLPYGTHTVRFLRNASAGNSNTISDFIIYQPKKPVIPVGAIEVADYNLMASFVGAASSLRDVVGQGVLRKLALRENTYVGTWGATLDVVNFNCGANVLTTTTASYFEYTFFGTGIEYKTFLNNAAAINVTFAINGSSNLTAFSASLIGTVTGLTFNTTTGILSGTVANAGNQNTIRITGLPLGLHRIRVTSNNTAAWYADAFDIITPIHNQQPSLKVGSNSLKSLTKYSPEKSVVNAGPDLSKAKAWWVYDMVNQRILKSYNVSAILLLATGQYQVFFEKPFKTQDYAIAGTGELSQRFITVAGAPTVGNSLGSRSNSLILTITTTTGTLGNSNRETAMVFGELAEE